MSLDFTDKVVIVTGAGGGLGKSHALDFARRGAKVVVNDLGGARDGTGTSDAAAQVVEQIKSAGGEAIANGGSVTEYDQMVEMVAKAKEAFGGVHILINNAGIQHVAPVDEFPEDKWDEIMSIILSSAFHTTKAALPAMKAKGWGRVINTGSMHSLVASPFKSAYNAAKHGLAGFSKTVALEVATQGITVNNICPGYVWTSLVENQIPDTMKARGLTREQVINDVLLANQPQKKFVQVEQLAALAVFLCRDEASAITGTNLSVDGGWTAQ